MLLARRRRNKQTNKQNKTKQTNSLGNLLRCKLLEDPRVLFAGYQMPHPLENIMHVKVQVRPVGSALPCCFACAAAVSVWARMCSGCV